MTPLKYLSFACVFLVPASSVPTNAAPSGFVEGHLKIISPREVELADGTPPVITAQNYAEYRLIILTEDQKNEFVRLTADANGSYHVASPPGTYARDLQ